VGPLQRPDVNCPLARRQAPSSADDIAAELFLQRDDAFRRKAVGRSVQVRMTGDAVGIDPPAIGQGEHLVAAGIGQDRMRPGHEGVQAAHPFDDLGAGPKVQVVGVGQHKPRTQVLELRRRQSFDRRLRADRSEERGLQIAVRCLQFGGARPTVTRFHGEGEPGHSPQIQWRPTTARTKVVRVKGRPIRR
jgi:hypothetical protein